VEKWALEREICRAKFEEFRNRIIVIIIVSSISSSSRRRRRRRRRRRMSSSSSSSNSRSIVNTRLALNGVVKDFLKKGVS
jgi:hypothetical protein